MAINCNPGPLLDNAHCLESCLMEDQLQAIATWLLTQIDGVSADPGSLLNSSKCLSDCLETGQLLNIKAWILVQLAGDSNSNEVLSEAKCFEGCVTARQQDAIQVWLLSQKADLSDDPSFLFQNSKCLFNCLTWQQQLGIQVYLLAIKAGISPLPGSLLESARCFAGCLTEEQANSVITLELCHWANQGGCPIIALQPDSLPGASCGDAYSQLVTASGGTAPYSFTLTAGALPTTLSLAANGLISGTLSESGTFNFTITATDSLGCTGSKAYSLVIAARIQDASSLTFDNFDFSGSTTPVNSYTATPFFDGTYCGVDITSPDFVTTAGTAEFDFSFDVTCKPCFTFDTQTICANGTCTNTSTSNLNLLLFSSNALGPGNITTNPAFNNPFGAAPLPDPICSGDDPMGFSTTKINCFISAVLDAGSASDTMVLTVIRVKFKLLSA